MPQETLKTGLAKVMVTYHLSAAPVFGGLLSLPLCRLWSRKSLLMDAKDLPVKLGFRSSPLMQMSFPSSSVSEVVFQTACRAANRIIELETPLHLASLQQSREAHILGLYPCGYCHCLTIHLCSIMYPWLQVVSHHPFPFKGLPVSWAHTHTLRDYALILGWLGRYLDIG